MTEIGSTQNGAWFSKLMWGLILIGTALFVAVPCYFSAKADVVEAEVKRHGLEEIGLTPVEAARYEGSEYELVWETPTGAVKMDIDPIFDGKKPSQPEGETAVYVTAPENLAGFILADSQDLVSVAIVRMDQTAEGRGFIVTIDSEELENPKNLRPLFHGED